MITYYVAASVDGFIAGPNHELDFLDAADDGSGEDYGYKEFYDSIDTCVWGKATYDVVMKTDAFPYPEKENWILSRNKVGLGDHKEVFARYNTDQWKRASAEKNIWLVGGGEVASLFLADKLIDKLILSIIPSMLGEGKKLFTEGLKAEQWHLEKSQGWPNGVTQNTYLFKK